MITGEYLPAVSTLLAPIGCHKCSGLGVKSELLVSESKRKLDLKSKKLLNGWCLCLCMLGGLAQGERTGSGQQHL